MEPPVTYSHPKSVIVMIHMMGDEHIVLSGWFFPCGSDVRILPSVAAWKNGWDSAPCPPALSNPHGQVWKHASVLIRILKLSVCGSVKISIR